LAFAARRKSGEEVEFDFYSAQLEGEKPLV
jgi:hypothetical protein